VTHGACGEVMEHGPFKYRDGVGFHEVVIFRDPDKYFNDFTLEEMEVAVKAYRDRYKEILQDDKCQKFTLIFHNHGKEAGASLAHPHSQIISVPVYPPDMNGSLEGAERYYKDNNKKVHQIMVESAMEDKERTVYENDKFIVLCPYASRLPYEVRIYPKDFGACFDMLPDEDLKEFADVMRVTLRKIYKGLNDPPYNFYIHTAPGDEGFTCPATDFYTWHVEILPKISTLAGFELGTGMDVNVVDPREAAEILKNS
jgi:UDPglucose--hexose-1-phosphate uridylyltransferase